MNNLVATEAIASRIYFMRSHKVMLDRDLAELYGVETRTLKQAVRRNIRRFPEDFMFVLDKDEFEKWRSQNVMSNSDKMGLRHPPMAFTEQGVAMLSSVLKSERAIEVNIAIMRAFVRMRELLTSNKKMAQKLEELEQRLVKHDENFRIVFDAIKSLLKEEEKPKRKIGF